MDRLGAAEAVLDAARARSTRVVCPGYAQSPMDADITTTVAREVITACEAAATLPTATIGASEVPTAHAPNAALPTAALPTAGRVDAAPMNPELLDSELLRIAQGPPPATGRSRTA